ncbi:MAG TPA: hypothetical protein VLA29_00695 [Acidimicrobiia bacterium]|nr:hypothetical protein [Acidimicrobiia bacterium]
MSQIVVARLDAAPLRRHDHRVRSVSVDYDLLRRLDHLIVDDRGARQLVELVCSTVGTPTPLLRFHARRSPFTGATEAPRWLAMEIATRRGREPGAAYRAIPEHGAIRLGRRTTLMTVAHELGHHMVHHLDKPGTPAHGHRWVERFDQAAAVIDGTMNP